MVRWLARRPRRHAGTFTFTSAALPDNTYSFTATATDAADNTSAASAPFAIIIDHTLPSGR